MKAVFETDVIIQYKKTRLEKSIERELKKHDLNLGALHIRPEGLCHRTSTIHHGPTPNNNFYLLLNRDYRGYSDTRSGYPDNITVNHQGATLLSGIQQLLTVPEHMTEGIDLCQGNPNTPFSGRKTVLAMFRAVAPEISRKRRNTQSIYSVRHQEIADQYSLTKDKYRTWCGSIHFPNPDTLAQELLKTIRMIQQTPTHFSSPDTAGREIVKARKGL